MTLVRETVKATSMKYKKIYSLGFRPANELRCYTGHSIRGYGIMGFEQTSPVLSCRPNYDLVPVIQTCLATLAVPS